MTGSPLGAEGALAYGIDSWYPVVRGGPAPVAAIQAADPEAAEKLARTWAGLGEGERLVLLGAAAPGARSPLAGLEAPLSADGAPERFVVFPGTGGSFTLLPTADGAALRGGTALLPAGRARGRALWGLIRTLSPLGIARRLGRPEVSIWTKGTPGSDGDLAALPVGCSIAVTAGVPDRNQKVIVRAMDRRGTARAILKIGFSERSDDAVTREAAALERMAELAPHLAPRLIASGERAGRAWMAQEVLAGKRSGDDLTPAHVRALVELGRIGRGLTAMDDLPAYRDGIRNLAALDPSFDADWHDAYLRLRRGLEETGTGDGVPTTLAHGDFTPWNVMVERGAVRAFDWEYFAEAAPALQDALHFHVQTSILVRQQPGARIHDSLEALFAGPAGELVRAMELAPEDVLRSLGLYLLHEGTSAEVQERLRPAPFAQATWLRRARLVLAERVGGLLLERRLPGWATLAARPEHPGRSAA